MSEIFFLPFVATGSVDLNIAEAHVVNKYARTLTPVFMKFIQSIEEIAQVDTIHEILSSASLC